MATGAARLRTLVRARSLAAASLLSLSLLDACAPVQRVRSPSGYCAPPAAPVRGWREDQAAPGSSRAARSAALLGISSALQALRVAAPESSLAARVQILQRLESARIAIDATVAELDCEGERAAQLAAYLESRERRTSTVFTASSIAAGAASAIASAFLAGADRSVALQEAVAVSGGTLTAALGLVPLFVQGRAEFEHPRNMLADVWSGPAVSMTFPELVWAYLTRAEFSNEQAEPIRTRLIARWRQFRTIEDDPQVAALLFGSGGTYDAQLLRHRADMLDQLKAEVHLMNQDLAALAAVVEDGSRP